MSQPTEQFTDDIHLVLQEVTDRLSDVLQLLRSITDQTRPGSLPTAPVDE